MPKPKNTSLSAFRLARPGTRAVPVRKKVVLQSGKHFRMSLRLATCGLPALR